MYKFEQRGKNSLWGKKERERERERDGESSIRNNKNGWGEKNRGESSEKIDGNLLVSCLLAAAAPQIRAFSPRNNFQRETKPARGHFIVNVVGAFI